MPENDGFYLQNPLPIPLMLTDKFNSIRSYGRHEGIDLKAIDEQGSPLQVVAAQRGVVVKVGFYGPGYGNYVMLRHEWADGNVYISWYGHLSRIDVRAGDFVASGAPLGIAGSTGNSTGIHLHLTLQHLGHGLSGYVVPDVIDPWPLFRQVQPIYKQLMFISDETIPDGTLLQPGTPFIKTWRIANSGSIPWQTGDELAFSSGEQMGAPASILLPALGLGQQASISLEMVAPLTQGRHSGVWKAHSHNGQSFDFPLWVEILTAGSTGVDGATYLADVSVPDGTVFTPGQTFLKEWRVRNSGSSAWRSGYRLAHVDDERLEAPESVAVPFTRTGEEAVVSISLKAPQTPGNYRSTWQLRNLEGQPFGEILYAQVRVEPVQASFNQLTFVSDVTIPADTHILSGAAFRKIWRVRNSGSTAWTAGFELVHHSGENFGALPSNLKLSAASGDTLDLALDMTAPPQPGIHEGSWIGRDPAGRFL